MYPDHDGFCHTDEHEAAQLLRKSARGESDEGTGDQGPREDHKRELRVLHHGNRGEENLQERTEVPEVQDQ